MSKMIMGLILFLGVVSFVGCFGLTDDREKENNSTTATTMVIKKQEKREDKSESLFKEVSSLARLEFFKIDAVVNEKFLMVYFYSDNCGYCEKMKKETFSDFRVEEVLAENYSAVRIDYSKYKQAFSKLFSLQSTPAIFIFDREGKEIKDESFYGYQGAEDFYNKISLLSEPF